MTKKQKDCMYCHEPTIPIVEIDSRGRQCQLYFIQGQTMAKMMMDGVYRHINIKHCPICGRKL